MHEVGPQPKLRPSSWRNPIFSATTFCVSVTEVRSSGESESKGSNPATSADSEVEAEVAGVVVVDLKRANNGSIDAI